jgi:hypothetical protein
MSTYQAFLFGMMVAWTPGLLLLALLLLKTPDLRRNYNDWGLSPKADESSKRPGEKSDPGDQQGNHAQADKQHCRSIVNHRPRHPFLAPTVLAQWQRGSEDCRFPNTQPGGQFQLLNCSTKAA